MNDPTSTNSDASRLKNLNRTLWIMQGFLFFTFGAAGIMKLTMPIDRLTAILSWPGAVPEFLMRAIGAAEIAGAMGVLLPALVRMQAWITPYAAMGLATVMICAVGYHLMRPFNPRNQTRPSGSAYMASTSLSPIPSLAVKRSKCSPSKRHAPASVPNHM